MSATLIWPWSFPMMVFGRKKNQLAAFSDLIQGNPTVSADFRFTGPHTLVASTWKQPGSPEDKVPVTVDLEDAFANAAAGHAIARTRSRVVADAGHKDRLTRNPEAFDFSKVRYRYILAVRR